MSFKAQTITGISPQSSSVSLGNAVPRTYVFIWPGFISTRFSAAQTKGGIKVYKSMTSSLASLLLALSS